MINVTVHSSYKPIYLAQAIQGIHPTYEMYALNVEDGLIWVSSSERQVLPSGRKSRVVRDIAFDFELRVTYAGNDYAKNVEGIQVELTVADENWEKRMVLPLHGIFAQTGYEYTLKRTGSGS